MTDPVYSIDGLHYDPGTGVFTKDPGKGITPGKCGSWTGCHGYLDISHKGKRARGHQWAVRIMTGKWPAEEVDHINGDRTDNRWCNLREVSKTENAKNQRLSSNNTSGHVGVQENNGSWMVRVGKEYITTVKCKQEAIRIRREAALTRGYHANHGRQH